MADEEERSQDARSPPAGHRVRTVGQRVLLEALDDHPATPEELARALATEPEPVEQALARAQNEGLATDWGGVWATTWKAKLDLEPGFFRLWIPVSLALGATITAMALTLNTAGTTPALLVGLVILATGALGVLAVTRGRER